MVIQLYDLVLGTGYGAFGIKRPGTWTSRALCTGTSFFSIEMVYNSPRSDASPREQHMKEDLCETGGWLEWCRCKYTSDIFGTSEERECRERTHSVQIILERFVRAIKA